MVIKNKKIVLTSIFTCITVIFSICLCFNNNDFITAASNLKKYKLYTYETSSFSEYDLPNLSVLWNDGINNMTRAIEPIDNRENSKLEQQIVRIGSGTGFIIGDHEIMTAAHVLINLDTHEISKPNVYIPKSNPSNGTNDIKLNAVCASFPKDALKKVNNWEEKLERIGNDYAILKVEEDLTKYGSAFLGLGVTNNVVKNNLYALGYKFGNEIYTQKISSGKILETGDTWYNSSSIVFGGTSGGPLYCQYQFGVPGSTDTNDKVQTYKTVLGITSTTNDISYSTGEFIRRDNYFVRITPEILQFAYNNSNI